MHNRSRIALSAAGAVALLLLSTGAIPTTAAPPADLRFAAEPPARAGSPYRAQMLGVGIHFGAVSVLGYTSGARAGAQMKALGVDAYRDGIPWSAYDFADIARPEMKQRRRIMDFLPITRARPLLVLSAPGFEPPMHGMPFTDRQLAEFAAYTRSVVGITRGRDPIFEVWNEYNMKVGYARPSTWLSDEGDPSDARAAVHYAVLAKTATAAVRQANPRGTVVVGAVGVDPDWKWTRAIVRYGALDGADGLSIHLYNHCSRPEDRNAPEMIARLERLQSLLKADRGGRETPLYVTEFGWPTTNTRCAISVPRQAANFAHYILQSSTLPWLRGSWIYELKDHGVDARDVEENFGTYRYDDAAKLAVCFVREARAIVSRARAVELKQPRPGTYALRAVLADRQVLAIWTTDATPAGTVRLATPPRSARMMCGQAIRPGAAIPLSQTPLIVVDDVRKPLAARIGG